MATTFAVAADKELWDALNHKSTLLETFRAKNSSHPERDNLAIAHTILESFLTRLGAILDVESPEAVPGYLKSISAKTESALLAPIQCDLVDGNADRVARKTTNAIITSTHQHMSDGTLIVTQKQMGCAVALICAEARPKLTAALPHLVLEQVKGDLLVVFSAVPLPHLRKELWERAAKPHILELIDYVRCVVIDAVLDPQQRRELSQLVGSLCNPPPEEIVMPFSPMLGQQQASLPSPMSHSMGRPSPPRATPPRSNPSRLSPHPQTTQRAAGIQSTTVDPSMSGEPGFGRGSPSYRTSPYGKHRQTPPRRYGGT